MGLSFFARKGRMQTSRSVALVLNTMNMLGPVLLVVAVALLLTSWAQLDDPQLDDAVNRWALGLIVGALALRIIWGVAIWRLRRKATAEEDVT